jgi:cytochrome c peroxidase
MVQSQFVPFPNFTEQENRGKQLFMIGESGLRCVVCHGGESFTSPGIRNNGLDVTYADAGVGGVTGNANEVALFKAPSLRSILLRPPYMHDGRFATIEEVIDHYSTGIQAHPNLDMELRDFQTGLPKRFDLTEADKEALIAFMATLTDSALVTDPKFSDPFK